MVFLAREIHRPVRPVDGLSGEDGDILLATAQMPQKLIEGSFFGVLLSLNDLLVLLGSDCFLGGVPKLWPLAARNNRSGDPAHI